jgi:ribonuclease BN (tRNA processing enzyme)
MPDPAPPLVQAVPTDELEAADFLAGIEPSDLVYFLLNVGDGDTQLVLLPVDPETGRRQALIVDVASEGKLTGLLEALESTRLFSAEVAATAEPFAVVVATHPHADHMAGLPGFLDRFHAQIGEFWEPGYFHTSAGYHNMMTALETHRIPLVQPTSGTMRFVGQVKVTVLTPGISLRNRFDTYGVEVNNSSIAMRLEFPATRIVERNQDRTFARVDVQSLILGADAQTQSWAQAMVDFPELRPTEAPVAAVLDRTQGHFPLKADIFKVSHHGSKHGMSLELVETMKPKYALISSVSGAGKYNFPHVLCLEALREARDPIAANPNGHHKPDYQLGIHATAALDSKGRALGSIALVMSATSSKCEMWRFGDQVSETIDLTTARRLK